MITTGERCVMDLWDDVYTRCVNNMSTLLIPRTTVTIVCRDREQLLGSLTRFNVIGEVELYARFPKLPYSLWSPAACRKCSYIYNETMEIQRCHQDHLGLYDLDRNHTLADTPPNLFLSINILLNVRELAYEHSLISRWREDSSVVAFIIESIAVW